MIRGSWPLAAWLISAMLLTGCSGGGAEPDRGSSTAGEDGPTAAEDHVTVRRGDLNLQFTLDASTSTSPAVNILSHEQLSFRPEPNLIGQHVRRGQKIGTVGLDNKADSMTSSLPRRSSGLEASLGDVKAVVDGRLLTSGGAPRVEANGIDVVANLSPIQYLRYLSMTFEGRASVETTLGPAIARCDAMWAVPSQQATNELAAQLHCRLPPQVETAPGLRATLTMASSEVKDVLLVPNLYIDFNAATNAYYVDVERDGRTRRVRIEVGVTDGVVRAVRGDIFEGDLLMRHGAEDVSP